MSRAGAPLPKPIDILPLRPPFLLLGEVTEPGRRTVFRRPDGSLTHW